MAISGTMFDGMVEIEISGETSDEFYDSLEQFKSDIDWHDRKWDPNRKAWQVKEHKKYMHLDYIQEAVGAGKDQLPLL